jgi:hypothetical protein
MAAMRALPPLLLAIFLALLSGCGPSRPAPVPTVAPAPTLPAIRELLAAPAAGPISTFGYLYLTGEGAALLDGLSIGEAGEPALVDDAGLWLEPAPALPADLSLVESGGARYGIVAARGTLEGPAAYGPGGAYRYRLAAAEVEPLSVRELSIPLLLANPALYEGQAVRLQGQLLASPESALLVERIGAGGVPEDSALQLKLAIPPQDTAVVQGLQPAGDGSIRFGPVEITGLWRGDRLYPLSLTPAPN